MHEAITGREVLKSLCDDEYISPIGSLRGCRGCLELRCLLQAVLVNVPKPEKVTLSEPLTPLVCCCHDCYDDEGGDLDG